MIYALHTCSWSRMIRWVTRVGSVNEGDDVPVSICLLLLLTPLCNNSSSLAILLINDVPNAGTCSSCFCDCCFDCLLLVKGDLCEGLHWIMLGLPVFAFTRCLSSAYLLGVCPLTVASGDLSSLPLSSLMVLSSSLARAITHESSWSKNATPQSASTNKYQLPQLTDQHAKIMREKHSSMRPCHYPLSQRNEID